MTVFRGAVGCLVSSAPLTLLDAKRLYVEQLAIWHLGRGRISAEILNNTYTYLQ